MFPRTRLFNSGSSRTISLALLILTAVLLVALAAPAAAAPKTRFVDIAGGANSGDCTDPANPCKTIGYALDKSFQSDVIKVAQGTYRENLVIINNVNLYGGFHAGSWDKKPVPYGSIINGQKRGSVIRYEDGFAGTLDGFKIINGKAPKGGGIYVNIGSVVLQNLWITGNEAGDVGGGVYFNMGQPSISSSKIDNNRATNGGGALYISHASSKLSGLTVKNNTAADGGALSLFSTGIVSLSDSDVVMNEGGRQSGAVHLMHGELHIIDSVIAGNKARDHGGAITAEGSQLEIVNGLFYGNRTTVGPASVLVMGSSEAYVVNSTFANNAPSGHQAILVWSGFLHLKNSIMWNNALNLQTDPPCPSCIKVTYSDVQGHVDNPVQDSNNIDADPLFRDPGSADFRLKSGSPCINAGSPNGVNPVPPKDIDGNPRSGKPDMGAYEYVAPVYKFRANLPMITGK